MNDSLAAALGRALAQTRAGDPAAATRIIQAAMGRSDPAAAPEPARQHRGAARSSGRTAALLQGDAVQPPARPHRWSLREAVETLGRGRPGGAKPIPGLGRVSTPPPVPAGARFELRSFACPQGTRDYRLYVPAALPDGPQGLVMMLHGCTQDADDFACGTRMNTVAERHGLLVAYPNQTNAHNAMACWNWFRPTDQGRGSGEPAILAGLARALRQEFAIDSERVFAAGLSAGGAMAAILGVSYPDVFSAVGIHSGLPHGCAHDVVSAFAAMRGDAGAEPASGSRSIRTIVFHGSADATVHPSNAETIVRLAHASSAPEISRTTGRSPGDRGYTRAIAAGQGGTTLTELWLVEDAGHAWSGGSATGSYTDPDGPDASAEMVRFFLGSEQERL